MVRTPIGVGGEDGDSVGNGRQDDMSCTQVLENLVAALVGQLTPSEGLMRQFLQQ